MTPTLQDAIAAVRAGETERAQLLAADVIRDNPDDAHAWYLLSQLVDSDARRALYLRKTLALDPEHARARAEFDALPAAAVASLGWTAGDMADEGIGEVTQPLPEMAVEAPAAEVVTVAEAPAEVVAVEAPVELAASVAPQPEPELEAAPDWLRPLSPEPVPAAPAEATAVATATTATAAVTTPTAAPVAPAPARRTPPPPARRQGNGALAALLVLLILLTLAVLAILAYLLIL